jgi:16S rRNA (uracil1498-N3)-methyltransferase
MAGQSTLPRFYCPHLPHPRLSDRYCNFEGDEAHHARKVLRLQPGDAVELFNGQGGVARAVIEGFDAGKAFCRVLAVDQLEPARPRLLVAAAMPKGPHADDMINQLSQVAVDQFTPLLTQRSVVDPRPSKLDRLSRQVIESAKQAGRPFLMTLQPPTPLAQVLGQPAELRLIAVPGEHQVAELGQRMKEAMSVLVLVGPEGGWTDEEMRAAIDAGFLPWTIGPSVLRIETAAVVAAGVLRYLLMTQP